MIVRILGKGQFQLDDSLLGRLNELDNAVAAAVAAGDPAGFSRSFAELIGMVEGEGNAGAGRAAGHVRPRAAARRHHAGGGPRGLRRRGRDPGLSNGFGAWHRRSGARHLERYCVSRWAARMIAWACAIHALA